MKNQSLQTLGLAFAAVVGFSACNGLGKMVKKADTVTYTVTPQPLEMHGDSVAVAISGKYPAKYFAKKATLTITPKLGTAPLKPVTLVGESAQGNGTKIKFKEGGSFSYTDKVAYTPEMKNADLTINATGAIKSKTKDFPAKKIGEGTIVTPLLVKNDEKGIVGKDNFQKVIPRKSESQIFFVINQSTVRPSELNSEEMKTMKEFIKTGVGRGYQFKNMNISAYASPDGELSLNADLAEDRANSSTKAMQSEFKKSKLDAAKEETFFNKVTTAEDWEGFKRLMEGSDIEDKDIILRVLTTYPDGEKREQEIKNISKTYTVIADKILPKLRRSVLTLNADEMSRSDERITQLANSTPDSLSVEELLYAATLTNDVNNKLTIYKAAEKQYAEDWRAANNVGYVYLMQNKAGEAEAQFQKADKLSANNPIVQNNLGIVARWKGDRKAAMEYYKKASGAGSEVSNNMGVVHILNGDYSAAVAAYGATNSFNAALAKILNGTPDAAVSTIDNSPEKDDAMSYYLKAVAGARANKADQVVNNLKIAIQKDASIKETAKTDLEFHKWRDKEEFKAVVQ